MHAISFMGKLMILNYHICKQYNTMSYDQSLNREGEISFSIMQKINKNKN